MNMSIIIKELNLQSEKIEEEYKKEERDREQNICRDSDKETESNRYEETMRKRQRVRYVYDQWEVVKHFT